MKILALDLATKTGWAQFVDNSESTGRIESGVFDFASDGHKGMRAIHCWQAIEHLVKSQRFDAIYYEKPYNHSSNQAAHMFGWWECLMHMALANNGQPMPIQISPAAIKKFITGKGNANKEAVIAAIKARGYKPKDDNEADALALLLLALDQTNNSQYFEDPTNELPF